MMPICLSLCLMNLPHKKQGVSEQNCGRKNRPALSATSSQTDTLSSGKARRLLQSRIIRKKNTDERAQAAGNGARVRLMLLGGTCWGDVMRERQVMRKREKRPAQQLIDATSARHSTGLAHPGIGAARWTSLPRAP